MDASAFLAQRQLKYGPWHPWYKIDWLVVLVTVLMALGLKCWLHSEPSTEPPPIEQKLEQTRSMFIEIGESEELLQNTGTKVAGPTSSNIASRESEMALTSFKEDLKEEALTSPEIRSSEDFKVRFELDDTEPEIRLPAAGEKYPLGLARSPGTRPVVILKPSVP